MPPIGQRGFRLSVLGVFAVVVMWCAALLVLSRRPEPIDFLMLGLGIGAALAGSLGPGAVRAIGEWNARAKDQASIPDQIRGPEGKP